jgi:hypothetical protein
MFEIGWKSANVVDPFWVELICSRRRHIRNYAWSFFLNGRAKVKTNCGFEEFENFNFMNFCVTFSMISDSRILISAHSIEHFKFSSSTVTKPAIALHFACTWNLCALSSRFLGQLNRFLKVQEGLLNRFLLLFLLSCPLGISVSCKWSDDEVSPLFPTLSFSRETLLSAICSRLMMANLKINYASTSPRGERLAFFPSNQHSNRPINERCKTCINIVVFKPHFCLPPRHCCVISNSWMFCVFQNLSAFIRCIKLSSSSLCVHLIRLLRPSTLTTNSNRIYEIW